MFSATAVGRFDVVSSDYLDTIPLTLFWGPSSPKIVSCLEKGVCYIDSGLC